jgi:hypothetical protein
MGIDNETRDFLMNVANTLAVVLGWMIIDVYFGIYYNWAFIEGGIHWQNWVFYTWFIISLTLLIFYIRHKWKDKM